MGSITALAKIADYAPEPIFDKLALVISAYETGSVITVDNSISVFAKLCNADENYPKTVLPIIINHLLQCKPKELAQHAERAAICYDSKNAGKFIEVLEKRMSYLTSSQQTRINRLLKKLRNMQHSL